MTDLTPEQKQAAYEELNDTYREIFDRGRGAVSGINIRGVEGPNLADTIFWFDLRLQRIEKKLHQMDVEEIFR